MARRKREGEPPTPEKIRELRQAVKDAKGGYHEAKARKDEEQMEHFSELIGITMAELALAEEAANG